MTGARRASRSTRELRVGTYARFDADRVRRTGAPEVILGEGKRSEHLLGLLHGLKRRGRGALVSRPTPAQLKLLRAGARGGLPLTFLANDRVVRLAGPLGSEVAGGTVALLSGGTADVGLAEEARAILEELGVRVVHRYDVGVAGVHRLDRALKAIARERPAVYLVFAGREGSLPTVVAGLVRAPVVGIPTSVGYGRGGRG
ncbi:MAG: AIR carboxylase family protein, partial [Candidatus Lutacidiplasmatales archaeon]